MLIADTNPVCFARYDFNGRTLKVHFDRFAVNAAPANGSIPVAPAQYTGAFSASMAQGTVAAPTAAAAATALDLPGLATGAGLNVSGGIPGLPVPGTGAAGPAGGTALAGGAPLTSSPYVLMRPQQPSPYVQQAMQRNAMLLQQQQHQHHPHSFAASFLSQNQPQHFPPYDKSLTSAAMRSWPPDRNSTTNSSPAPPPASSTGPSSSASPSPALTAAAAATEDTPLQRTHSIASHVSSASHASNPSGEQRRMERPSLPLRGESSLPRPPTAATEAANRASGRSAGRPGRIEMPPSSLGYMPSYPGFGFNPPGVTPWGGESFPATPHAHLPPHLLSPGVAFTPGPRLVPSHIPLTPGAPFNSFVNPAPGAPVHFHPGTPSAHMPFYMGMPTPLDPATPQWPAPATPQWGVVYPMPNGVAPQPGAQPPAPPQTQRPTQDQPPGTPPVQSQSSEGYPFPVVPPQDRMDREETVEPPDAPGENAQDESALADEGDEETTVKLYAFGQRRASTNSPAVSPMVERRGVGGLVPGPPGTPDRERRLSLSAARGRSSLAHQVESSPSGEPGDDALAEGDRAQTQTTNSTEELTRTIARMSVRGTALSRREDRTPAPAGDSVAERRGVGLSLHTSVSSPSN